MHACSPTKLSKIEYYIFAYKPKKINKSELTEYMQARLIPIPLLVLPSSNL